MDGEIGFRVFNDFRTAYRDNERSGELLLYLLSNDRGNGRKDAHRVFYKYTSTCGDSGSQLLASVARLAYPIDVTRLWNTSC